MSTIPAHLSASVRHLKAGRRDAISDNAAIETTVKDIIAAVRDRGDAAVRDYSKTFDKIDVGPLEISMAERKAALELTEANSVKK